jgi:hypothetical protein
MWWKFFMSLVFGLILGSAGVAALFLAAYEGQEDLQSAARDYSSHTFSNLTTEEINHQTLKAAAAVDRSHRRY